MAHSKSARRFCLWKSLANRRMALTKNPKSSHDFSGASYALAAPPENKMHLAEAFSNSSDVYGVASGLSKASSSLLTMYC